ncbi:MAG TPA: hypothetical protein VLB05_01325 [Dongiaceae bacterium]|nr:hypothetical protein [Dongiaceae bacterium]
MGALLFIYNLVFAPYRVERDRANAAEQALSELKERAHVEIPRGHLQAIERYDGTLSDLGERLNVIAQLAARYVVMTNASR